MKNKIFTQIIIILTVFFQTAVIYAAFPNNQTDFTVNAQTRADVIEKILKNLNEQYIFPNVAKQMADAILERVKRNEYDKISSAKIFAKMLTDDLREVSHDKHIVVEPSFEPIPEQNNEEETEQDREKDRLRKRREGGAINYGFDKTERLSGNVGYLSMSVFYPAEFGGDTAAAAMAFLNNTDALIIDLRDNDGGHPNMVTLLTSYFFDESVQLTGIYWRRDGDERFQESWTLPYISGKKYLGKNIYILTSKDGTVSAGEAFVYNLKILKRAIIVGETTAGAANPGGIVRLTDHFTMFIPTGRAFNPITKSTWEGVGIKPDIDVPASSALKVAHIEALKKIEEATQDEERKRYLRKLIEALE